MKNPQLSSHGVKVKLCLKDLRSQRMAEAQPVSLMRTAQVSAEQGGLPHATGQQVCAGGLSLVTAGCFGSAVPKTTCADGSGYSCCENCDL